MAREKKPLLCKYAKKSTVIHELKQLQANTWTLEETKP